jgi:prolyl-tRNA editing enzyme YbaK/EbsC (Cys-tRNA(Pro) deacylase)
MLISGGQWGLQIRIAPKDLVQLTNARFAPLSQTK